MLKRLGFILRGPALLFALIGLLAAGGAAANYLRTAGHGHGASAARPSATFSPTPTATVRPTPQPVATRRPTARPRPTATPRPTVRPRPAPRPTAQPGARLRLFVQASPGHTGLDVGTGVQVSIHHEILVTPGRGGSRPPPGQLWLLVDVSLTDRKTPNAVFSRNDFFAVAANGQTYTAGSTDSHHRGLSSGRLRVGASVRGWLGFRIPTLPTAGTIIWNDNNHLIPPAQLLKYSIHAA